MLNGWAPPALLQTYESERKPVALDTIADVHGDQVAGTTTFDAALFGAFGLPEVLPAGQ